MVSFNKLEGRPLFFKKMISPCSSMSLLSLFNMSNFWKGYAKLYLETGLEFFFKTPAKLRQESWHERKREENPEASGGFSCCSELQRLQICPSRATLAPSWSFSSPSPQGYLLSAILHAVLPPPKLLCSVFCIFSPPQWRQHAGREGKGRAGGEERKRGSACGKALDKTITVGKSSCALICIIFFLSFIF